MVEPGCARFNTATYTTTPERASRPHIYLAFVLGNALTFGVAFLRGRHTRDTSGISPQPDVWPLPFGAAPALAVAFVVWRLAFHTLFIVVHQAYMVVDWYVVPAGIVVDLSLAFGPRVVGYLLAGHVAALHPHIALISTTLSGTVVAITLYSGISLISAAHQIVPATPFAALSFACLTGAAGAVLSHSVATRVRESARRNSASQSKEIEPRLENSSPPV